MTIESHYTLTKINLAPENMMLDANNPRISWGSENGEYSPLETCKNATQASLLEELKKERHKLNVLVHSIATKGFVDLHAIIVKAVEGTDKYIVLEGNRRLAAIKLLVSNPRTSSIQTIQKIPVKIFRYIPNTEYSEQDVIDVLLATIHIGGPEGWGAMRKAQFVLKSYKREFFEKYSASQTISADRKSLKTVAENFNLKPGNVRAMIGAAQVFEQMINLGLPVSDDDYSLIEVAISKTHFREKVFEFDANKMTMSEEGLYRYSALCLEEGATISNPKEMDALAFVVSKSDDRLTKSVLDGEMKPSEAKLILKNNLNTTGSKLRKIYKELESISVSELANLNENDKKTAKNLASLLRHKLEHYFAD